MTHIDLQRLAVRLTGSPQAGTNSRRMDVLTLARIQFALTVAFDYLYPPLSIGLGVILVIIEAMWLKTRNPLYPINGSVLMNVYFICLPCFQQTVPR